MQVKLVSKREEKAPHHTCINEINIAEKGAKQIDDLDACLEKLRNLKKELINRSVSIIFNYIENEELSKFY